MKKLTFYLLLLSLISFLLLPLGNKFSSNPTFAFNLAVFLVIVTVSTIFIAGLVAIIHTGQLRHFGWLAALTICLITMLPLPIMLVIYLIAAPNTPAIQPTQQAQLQYPIPLQFPVQPPAQLHNQSPAIFCHACGTRNQLGQPTCLSCGRTLPTTL